MSQQKSAEDDDYAALVRTLGAVIEDAVYRGMRRALAETDAPIQQRPEPEHAAGQLVIEPEVIYSVAEAAAYLRCSRDTVYGLLRSGQLRGRKLGMQRCMRIEGAALREYLAGADEL